EVGVDDDYRAQHGDAREHRQIARPCREAGHRLRLVGGGKPAGHVLEKSAGWSPAVRKSGRPLIRPVETTDLRQIQGR
ncbi:hypothetical protein KXV85_004770, partial [Aspergillus fumigatus]